MTRVDPSKLRLSDERVATLGEMVRSRVRDVPDFPKKGILFRDITPVLANATVLQAAMALHIHHVADIADSIELVVAMESRGFLFGMGLAERIGAGFVPVRKPGKLPAATTGVSYELEYGADELEIHTDAIARGQRVLVVDDLLATGGTAAGTCQLIEGLGGIVQACLFLIELVPLGGRERLGDRRIEAVIRYA